MSQSFLLKSILSLFVLLFSISGFSTITITSVTGASSWNNDTPSAPVIYAGTAGSTDSGGPGCPSGSDATAVCNSCLLSTDTKPCNEAMVSSSTVLNITFSTDKSVSGTAKAKNESNVFHTGSAVSGAGTTTTLSITWSNICNSLRPSSSNCNEDIISTTTDNPNYFFIGIDTNGDGELDGDSLKVQIRLVNQTDVGDFDCANVKGFCDISVYPGDEKVFILSVSKNDPASLAIEGDMDVKSLVVMYSQEDFTNMSFANQTPYAEFKVKVENSTLVLPSDRIPNLENDKAYNFRFASKDEAGNIFNIQHLNLYESDCVIGTTLQDECDYRTTPSEVYGLLVDDLNCFIATASYGSTLHGKLDTLRDFKKLILARSQWGKKFIQFYYLWGPKAARWIYEHPRSRSVTQIFLWPVWGFAHLSLNWGLPLTSFLTLVSFFLLTSFFVIFVKKIKQSFFTT